MRKADKSSFWVIFDTGTIPEYYQDVHNVLAAPCGTIVRYNYREKYLCDTAISYAKKYPESPVKVLLAYGQYIDYERGADPRHSPSGTKMVWVPTRLAELVHLFCDAGNYYFDLRLQEYPYHDASSFGRIIDELFTKGHTPFSKWVAVSSMIPELCSLERTESSADNWDTIVAWFRKQSQYRLDAFWRLDGPYESSRCKALSPQETSVVRRTGRRREILQVRSYYPAANQQEIWFQVTNREPSDAALRQAQTDEPSVASGSAGSPSHMLEVLPRSTRVKPVHDQIPLRQYFSQPLRLVFRSDKLFEKQDTPVTFRTYPQKSRWPEGPNLELVFRTQWPLCRLLLGVVCGLAGITSVFAAGKVPFADLALSLRLFGAGTVLVLISGYLLYRELRLKY